jgi:fructose-1-phosphate kinase PfkB-like protein
MPVYTQLIKIARVPYKNFKPFHYCWRLAAFERQNIFLINLNIWNNFAYQDTDFNQASFGLKPLQFDMIPFDLTLIDDLLDVCFMRDHSNHKAYLVLSGNLTPDFKRHLFNQITQVFKSLEAKETVRIQ